MKKFVAVCGMLVAGLLASGVNAQEPELRPTSPFLVRRPVFENTTLDMPALKDMLTNLGYNVEVLKVGEHTAYKVFLKNADAERMHLVFVDPQAKTVAVTSGGFSSAPDVTAAPATWYAKVMNLNHRNMPRTVFINDHGVIGLTTQRGNSNITTDELKNLIDGHIRFFDENVIALAKELPATR